MTLLRTSLQVIAAIAIVLILFIVGYSIFNWEAVKTFREQRELRNKVEIFTGVKDMALTNNESYNTINENAPLYMNLKQSVNQAGGIEYTYNFWLYKDNSILVSPETTNDTSVYPDNGLTSNDIVLLLRGVDKAVSYKNICNTNKKDVYIKSPLIKLENYTDSLTVEFNTQKAVEGIREGATNKCTTTNNDWNEGNTHKVSIRNLSKKTNFDKQWFMVTVVLQDTYPSDPLPYRNRVRALIYINGVLELDQYIDNKLDEIDVNPSILKPNNGNLYIMPQIVIEGTTKTYKPNTQNAQKVMMADLSYFNYALDMDTVINMYKNGFNKYYAKMPTGDDPSTDLFNQMSYSDGKRQLIST